MANEEQLSILEQGVDVWNKWVNKNETSKFKELNELSDNLGTIYRKILNNDLWRADLSEANLMETELKGVNFRGANLNEVCFWFADLARSDLRDADLTRAELSNANFYKASLSRANFSYANLDNANLKGADLNRANFAEADLNKASLWDTNLWKANLRGADLKEARAGDTLFGNIDLSETLGLDEVIHDGPSSIDTHTLQLSKGKIPITFLRGCGLSDLDIEYAKLYNPDLSNQEMNQILESIRNIRKQQTIIQISPLFISYSRADAAFVDQLEVLLNEKGIRFWRDIHDATSGRLEKQIEQAIRHNPTVLLVLSKNAMNSDWVQYEVGKARGLEQELGRDVLCPVALDASWQNGAWPERIMQRVKEYNILDFSQWHDQQVFEQMFKRLLDGLQLFYKT